MPLTITDFIEQVEGVSTDDIPFDERERINDALADLTGGPGGTKEPVNNDAILVSKNLDGREGFNSIQSAVTNASTGNTIFVEPGEYSESVTIDVDDLTLEGPNAGIDGDSGSRDAEATINGTVSIGGDTDNSVEEAIIDGLKINGSSGGINAGNIRVGTQAIVENVNIKNSIINTTASATGASIEFQEVNNIEVKNNKFIKDGGGTLVGVSGVTPAVKNIEVSNNTLDNVERLYNSNGFVKRTGDISSTTVRIVDNDVNGAGTAIGIGDSEDALTAVDYIIKRNQIDTSAGIAQNAGTPASFTIEDNEFTGGSSTTYVDDSANELLDLNAILNNQGNSFDPNAEIIDEDDDGTDDRIVAK